MKKKKPKHPKFNHAGNPLEIVRPQDAQTIEDSQKLREGLQYMLKAMGVDLDSVDSKETHIVLRFSFSESVSQKKLAQGFIDIDFMHGETQTEDFDDPHATDFIIF